MNRPRWSSATAADEDGALTRMWDYNPIEEGGACGTFLSRFLKGVAVMAILTVQANLNNLHCVTPSDPSGEDEPYLWAFMVRADGDTIRQRAGDPGHLSANVTIFSGTGRPGNLGVDSFESGGNIHIPPAIGHFSAGLKPIVLTFAAGATSVRLFVPGSIAVFCLAIDEDGTARDAMEGAFNDVKTEVVTQFNDFLNGLDLQSMAAAALPTPNPAASFQNAFNAQLSTFLKGLPADVTNVAIQSAEISVMSDWWNPFETLASALDPDDPVGSGQFIFTEAALISTNLAGTMHADLRQSSTGPGGPWYIVDGAVDANLSFTSVDLLLTGLDIKSQSGPPQTFVFQQDHIWACVFAGTSVEVTTSVNTQKYSYAVQYPFANYRYSIDGQLLNGQTGSVVLTKAVMMQKFDENATHPASPFINNVPETRQVTLQFSKVRLANDPQIEVINIANTSADGNYDATLVVEAILPNGRVIHVGDEYLSFQGITLLLPQRFLKDVRQCLSNFVGTRWAKFKRVSVLDLWGPMQRQQEYERLAHELDRLAEVGAVQAASVQRAKQALARNLRVAPPKVQVQGPVG